MKRKNYMNLGINSREIERGNTREFEEWKK